MSGYSLAGSEIQGRRIYVPASSTRNPSTEKKGKSSQPFSEKTQEKKDSEGKKPSDDGEKENDRFLCHICLEEASDPVVTLCGHLFCWDCLGQWVEVSHKNECPVCKGVMDLETVVPIYSKSSKPHAKSKPRPRPNVPTNEFRNNLQTFFGFLPFPFFAIQFGVGQPAHQAVTQLFVMIAILVFASIILS